MNKKDIPKKEGRLFDTLQPKEIEVRDYTSFGYTRRQYPAHITPPVDPTAYASHNSRIGRVYYPTLEKAYHDAVYSHGSYSHDGGNKAKCQAGMLNDVYGTTREAAMAVLDQYIFEHDGVIDGWPDPEPSGMVGVVRGEGNDDTEDYYGFAFFDGDYVGTEFNYVINDGIGCRISKASKDSYYPVWAAEADIEAAENLAREFGLFNFLFEAGKLYLRLLIPILLVVGIIAALCMGFFGLDPLFVSGIVQWFDEFSKSLPGPGLSDNLILTILVGIPVLLLISLPLLMLLIANIVGMVVMLFDMIIGIRLVSMAIAIAALCIAAAIGQHYVTSEFIPKPQFFDPRIASRARKTIREIEKIKNSPVFKKIAAEEQAEYDAKQNLLNEFYRGWYDFYQKMVHKRT